MFVIITIGVPWYGPASLRRYGGRLFRGTNIHQATSNHHAGSTVSQGSLRNVPIYTGLQLSKYVTERYQWPLLLTWFNFNPSMNDTPSKVWDEITYPCKEFKLIHISKRDTRCSQRFGIVVCREFYLCVSTPSVSKDFALSVSSLRDMCLRHLYLRVECMPWGFLVRKMKGYEMIRKATFVIHSVSFSEDG